MQNDTSEYLPQESESRPHKKVFQLAPVEDDLTGIILSVRLRVIEDKTLHLGARLMFVYLLDLSLRRTMNVRPGVVTISQTKLAEKFGVSHRTIYNWKWQLSQRRLVWCSSQPMPNTWPIDTYHIEAIHGRDYFDSKTSVEGFWGNGGRRSRPETSGNGAREPGQTILPGITKKPAPTPPVGNGLPTGGGDTKSADLQGISAAAGNGLPLSAAMGCRRRPQWVAGAARNGLPAAPAMGCHGEPQPVAAGASNGLPPAPATGCRHKEAKGTGNQSSRGGEKPIAPPAEPGGEGKSRNPDMESDLAAWRQTLNGSFPSRLETLRAKLAGQREQATGIGREFLRRKIRILDEILEGPMPDSKPKPASAARQPATKVATIAGRQPTPDEILDGARYLLQAGKTKLLNAAHKAALIAAGELPGKA
jgi:hypothetical protein